MARDACGPFDFREAFGRNLLPLHDGGAGDAAFARNLREKAAMSANQSHAVHLHTDRLPPGSGQCKRKCLPTGSTARVIFSLMEIGHRIKEARAKAGLSQRELAKATGVSFGLVGQWESHRKKPGRENLLEIAKATTTSVAFLLGQEDIADMQITTNQPDEVALLRRYRLLGARQKQNLSQLIDLSVEVRQEIEHKRQPTKA